MAEYNFNNNQNQFNRPSNNDRKNQDDSLRRLSSQLNTDSAKEERKEKAKGAVKGIIVALLIIVLLGGIGFAVYFFTKNPTVITQAGTIKLSTKVTQNLTDESGDISISDVEIFPGEKYSVRCLVSNSDNADGDDNLVEYDNIFIRYSIILEIGGESYNNVVLPVITDLARSSWHIYNPDEETEDYVWDGYYYYYGSLEKNQRLTIFEEIQFDFHNTLNEFGDKEARITINIEAVHADPENLGVERGDAWNTAPRRWITNMDKGVNNNNEKIEI